MIEFELPQNNENKIKVIGVGGGGGNAVNHMYSLGIDEVDFVVCNTDKKALAVSAVPNKIQLGPELTGGLGAGAKPDVGMAATKESLDDIKKLFGEETKMVFVTAGMGGGTGTGGAPIVAKLAKESGALTVAIVTTPFSYEGKKRKMHAQEGIDELKKNVDTLLIISNDKVRQHFGNVGIGEAFAKADDVLATATKCITDVISSKGHIIVDFADVCTVMREGGRAILGNAKAAGENRAAIAVEEALSSPLLNDDSIQGAKWILLNVNSSQGVHEHTLDEMELIQAVVQEKAGDDCDLILGMGYDDSLEDNIGITLIATGFKENDMNECFKPSNAAMKNRVVMNLDEAKATSARNISDKAPLLGMADVDYTPTMFDASATNTPAMSSLGLKASDEIIFDLDDDIPAEAFLEPISLENEIHVAATEDAPAIDNMQEEDDDAKLQEEQLRIEERRLSIAEELEIQFQEKQNAKRNETINEEPKIEEISSEKAITFELYTKEEEAQPTHRVEETIQEIKNDWEKTLADEKTESELKEEMKLVEKTESELENDYVTIKGITLPRKKGSRLLTDYELEQEANFELQKRAFDERAARLRSMSYDVNKAEGQQHDEEEPAYIRRKASLDNHPHSSDEVMSGTQISADKNATNAHFSTLNNFLHGNNPD